ncbi:prolipoprotein diacylglyceryl transferase [Streptomyces cadmiisoli]|uniref:DNA primase n=1 Tax=Streptomyces cadmiisoli TaxID=2184053 RepID=UPI00364C16CC
MNRVALGLAVGAGYVLGRTKKMKLAIALGTLIAGKRLELSPANISELVTRQLQKDPQLKELSEELRADLRGAGKAASGALVERKMTALADRLHDRTSRVHDQISDIAPDVPSPDQGDEAEDTSAAAGDQEAKDEEKPEVRENEKEPAPSKDRPVKEAAAPAKRVAKKAPARKEAAPAKKAAPGQSGKESHG